MKRPAVLTTVLIVVLASPSLLMAVHEHHGTVQQAQEPGANPLIEEMLKLDAAIKEIASAVAVGDGDRVAEALMPVHGAMEKTHEGLHAGTVKLFRNADKVEQFVEMDRAFHDELERLGKAASENDVDGMLARTKTLLDGCVNCHKMFR